MCAPSFLQVMLELSPKKLRRPKRTKRPQVCSLWGACRMVPVGDSFLPVGCGSMHSYCGILWLTQAFNIPGASHLCLCLYLVVAFLWFNVYGSRSAPFWVGFACDRLVIEWLKATMHAFPPPTCLQRPWDSPEERARLSLNANVIVNVLCVCARACVRANVLPIPSESN